MPEYTGPQIAVHAGAAQDSLSTGSLQEHELLELHCHPTVRLARRLYTGIMASAQWSVEVSQNSNVDSELLERAQELISRQLTPIRSHFIKTAARGCVMRGWRGYEVVLDTSSAEEWQLRKLKPLTHGQTDILVNEDTGAFEGFKQPAPPNSSKDEIRLATDECLLVNLDVEGTDWRGESAYESAVRPWRAWNKVEKAAQRYDEKVAGAFWVIHYPLGQSLVDGQMVNNYDIAVDLEKKLRASGSVIVPKSMQDTLFEMNEGGKGKKDHTDWIIELKSDTGSAQSHFSGRQKYHDVNMVRAFGFTERSILEGEFGTKAEAGEHADLAITLIEQDLASLIEQLNWHLVNRLLRYNLGQSLENQVYIMPQPIIDSDRAFLREVFKAVLAGEFGDEHVDNIDADAMRDRLGVPTKPAETEPDPEPAE